MSCQPLKKISIQIFRFPNLDSCKLNLICENRKENNILVHLLFFQRTWKWQFWNKNKLLKVSTTLYTKWTKKTLLRGEKRAGLVSNEISLEKRGRKGGSKEKERVVWQTTKETRGEINIYLKQRKTRETSQRSSMSQGREEKALFVFCSILLMLRERRVLELIMNSVPVFFKNSLINNYIISRAIEL